MMGKQKTAQFRIQPNYVEFLTPSCWADCGRPIHTLDYQVIQLLTKYDQNSIVQWCEKLEK